MSDNESIAGENIDEGLPVIKRPRTARVTNGQKTAYLDFCEANEQFTSGARAMINSRELKLLKIFILNQKTRHHSMKKWVCRRQRQNNLKACYAPPFIGKVLSATLSTR